MSNRALVIAVLVVIATQLLAQGNESTQRVVERLLVKAGEEICARAGDSIERYTVSQHPDAAWIASMLRSTSPQRPCLSLPVDSLTSAQMLIVCRDVQTTYMNTHHQDTVLRRVVVSLDAVERMRVSQPYEVRLIDTAFVAREDVVLLDSRQHSASHGVVPPRPTTIWEDVTQPVVFIAAAVVTVVLLFTVRSQ